ncbi:MAG: SBBP repeat-containing protein, partial [Acidobacteriota bacterium]
LGGGLSDAFVTKFNSSGTGLIYSTYLGGLLTDEAWGIDVDPSGAAYVAGGTSSFDFPTVNPFQGTIGGGSNREDAFITKISDIGPPPVSADLAVRISDSPDPVPMGATLTYTLLVPNNGPDGATSVELTVRLDPILAFVSATSSQGSCGGPDPFNMILCQLGSLDAGVTATVIIDSIAPMSLGSLGTDAFVSAAQFDPNVNNNSDREVTDLTSSGFDLTVQLRGKGRVTSNPAGISCPGDCSQTFGSGTFVALTAQPDPGWRLRRWDGACAGTPIFQPCVVEMSADRQVKAEFRRRRR